MGPDRQTTLPEPSVDRAKRAVYAVFVANGFGFASWASRIPQVRDALELDSRSLGLVLLAMAVGSVVALPLAGLVVARLGPGRTIAVMSLVLAAGLSTAAVGQASSVAPVVTGLLLLGFGNGTWDVAMNVEGAAVEQRLGRSIMPRFHAGFSVGTVAGALAGALMIALHVSVMAHLLVVAAVVIAIAPAATRGFLSVSETTHAPDGAEGRSAGPLSAWREPRTLLLGSFVFCMAFAEGTGQDWLGVAAIDGYDASAALGSLTFAIFLAAMTAGRWFGPAVLNGLGRVWALRGSGVLAAAGLLLVVFGGSLPVAMAGAAIWGAGVALGFPVGMSAAADDPRRAAGRVSVVASIGYVAFLAGPPSIGFLADRVGTLRSLTVAAGLVGVGLLVSGVLHPQTSPDPAVPDPAAAGVG